MANDRQGPRGLVLLDEWRAAVSVDPLFERDGETLQRRVTIGLALWEVGLAGRLGLPTSGSRVDVER